MKWRVRLVGGRVIRRIAVLTVTGVTSTVTVVENSRAEKQLDD
jgi:hypothetical protein